MDGEFGVDRCQLLPLGWKHDEVLLCSTGNSVQSLVMEQDGGQREKKNVYVCIIASLFCTAETDRTLQINIIKNFLKEDKVV